MLQGIHKATKNWAGYIILVVMTTFLVAAFALWGVGDIFQGTTPTTIAEVGSRTIERTVFEQELKNQIRALSAQRRSELSMEEARQLGLDKMVLERLIDRVAIDEHVIALGLTASDEAIRAAIQRDPNFEGTTGTFNKAVFDELLRQAGITESQYIEGMRGDIARQQYMLAALAGIVAPPRLARLMFDYSAEERVAEYVMVRPTDVAAPPEPTEAELVAYHRAHPERFSTPEYREVEYIAIGVDQVASAITIPEADLAASWERRKAEFQKPELREVEQITFPNQAAAAAAHARITGGESFAAAARAAGKSENDIKLGNFPKAGLDPRIGEPAFALQEGGVSAPVQGPFGWAILRVVKITPGETKTFADMREQIRRDLLTQQAGGRIKDITDKFEDELAADKPFATAARIAGLPVQRVVVDAQGLGPDGAKANIPASAVFMQQVTTTDGGSQSDIFADPATHTAYAINVVGVRPPALKPLASIREEVRTALMNERRAKGLLARVQALAAQAQRDGSLAPIARALGRPPEISPALTRNKPIGVFTAEALGKLFGAPPGMAVYGSAGADGYVIARTTKVTHPTPQPAVLGTLRGQLSSQVAQDIGDTAAAAARKEVGVEIHQQTLQQALGQVQ